MVYADHPIILGVNPTKGTVVGGARITIAARFQLERFSVVTVAFGESYFAQVIFQWVWTYLTYDWPIVWRCLSSQLSYLRRRCNSHSRAHTTDPVLMCSLMYDCSIGPIAVVFSTKPYRCAACASGSAAGWKQAELKKEDSLRGFTPQPAQKIKTAC